MNDYTPAERIALMFVKRAKAVLAPDDFQKFMSETTEDSVATLDGVTMERAFHVCGFCTPADVGAELPKAAQRATDLYSEAFRTVRWALDQQCNSGQG